MLTIASTFSALALLRTGNVSFSMLPHIFLSVYLKVVYTLQSVSCTTGWLKRFEYSLQDLLRKLDVAVIHHCCMMGLSLSCFLEFIYFY